MSQSEIGCCRADWGRVLSSLFLTTLFVAFLLQPEIAQAEKENVFEIAIPATTADESVRMLSRQTGYSVIFQSSDVANVKTKPVYGRYTLESALEALFEGSNLSGSLTQMQVITISHLDVKKIDGERGMIVSDRKAGIFASFVALILGGGGDVLAQDESFGHSESADAESDGRIDEIVITATRRTSVLQDTPIAVTALGEETLRRIGASQFQDLVQFVPGLQMNEVNPGQRRLTIRGVQSSGEATVGLYYNETPVTGPGSANSDASGITPSLDMFDVERVEVLRGPQGTLFGASSLSGTMRVLFNDAKLNEHEGLIEGGFNSTKGGDLGNSIKGMVNVPLVDNFLAARLVLYREERGGWVDNTRLGLEDTNSSITEGGRLSLVLQPTENFDIALTTVIQNQEVADSSAHYPLIGYGQTDAYVRLPFEPDFDMYSVVSNLDMPWATLTVTGSTYNFEGDKYFDATRFSLSSIAAARFCNLYFDVTTCTPEQEAEYRAFGMSNAPYPNIQPMEVTSRILEARLTSAGSDSFQWTAGLFVEDREDFARSGIYAGDPQTGLARFPLVSVGIRTLSSELTQMAAYAEVGYHINDNWTLSLGSRAFTYDRTSISEVVESFVTIGGAATPAATFDADESGVTSKATLSYQFDDGLLLYSTFSQGFRPGGANNTPGLPVELIAYGSDSLNSYEVGTKFGLLDDKMFVDLTGYQLDWDDMLIGARIPGFSFITNLGKARVRGAELQVTYQPTNELSVTGTVASSNGELVEDQIIDSDLVITAAGRKGDRIPFEPKIALSTAVDYSRDIGAGRSAFIHVNASYTGKSYSTARSTDANSEVMGDYTLLNLRVGLENEIWSASIYVQNLFDEYGFQRVSSSGFGGERQTIAVTPRTAGIVVRRSF